MDVFSSIFFSPSTEENCKLKLLTARHTTEDYEPPLLHTSQLTRPDGSQCMHLRATNSVVKWFLWTDFFEPLQMGHGSILKPPQRSQVVSTDKLCRESEKKSSLFISTPSSPPARQINSCGWNRVSLIDRVQMQSWFCSSASSSQSPESFHYYNTHTHTLLNESDLRMNEKRKQWCVITVTRLTWASSLTR